MLDIMRIAFNAIMPVFLIMLLGYVCKRTGLIREEEQPRMNAIGFKIFMPIMLFKNTYESNLKEVFDSAILPFSVISLLVIYGLAILYATRFEKQRNRRGVVVQAIFRTNFALLGLSIVGSLYPEALGLAAVSVAIVVPMFNVLCVIVLEVFNGQRVEPIHMLKDIATNPLILACAAGSILSLWGIRFPKSVESMINSMGNIASPYLLFLLGVFFRFRFRMDRSLIACVLGRLIVVPAIVLPVAYLMGFRGGEFAVILTLFTAPPAVSSFTMTQSLGGDYELAGNSIVVASVCSILTIFLWACIYMSIGAF